MGDIVKGNQGRYGSIIIEIKLAATFYCNFIFEGHAVDGEARNLAKYSHALGSRRHIWLAHPHDPYCIPQHVDYDKENLALPLKIINSLLLDFF